MSGNGKAWLPAKTMPKEIEFPIKAERDKDVPRRHIQITCIECGVTEWRNAANGGLPPPKYCLVCSDISHTRMRHQNKLKAVK